MREKKKLKSQRRRDLVVGIIRRVDFLASKGNIYIYIVKYINISEGSIKLRIDDFTYQGGHHW